MKVFRMDCRGFGIVLLIFSCFAGAMSMTTENAMEYLKKYWYMGTNNPDPRIAALSDEDGFEVGLMSFQGMHGLNQTGILDEATIRLMSMPRCGMPDVIEMEDTHVNMGEAGRRRKKRFSAQGGKWPKKSLTYKITLYTPDLTSGQVDMEMRRAFAVWEMVTDLRFTQVSASANADIVILFQAGSHGDPYPFDGPSGTLAHAFFPDFGGDAHFDDAEPWTIGTYNGINLLQVAAHEIGHSLGLGHSEINEALMAPFYSGYDPNFMLHYDDVRGIQSIYGPPSTTPRPTTTTTTPRPERTPAGTTPRPTSSSTTQATTTTTQQTNTDLADLCATGTFDAITQHAYEDGSIKTYVFKNDYYAELSEGQVMPDYPKKITEGWPGLPNDIDAAIYWEATYNTYLVWTDDGWSRVEKLVSPARTYFFKGSQYWRFRNGQMDAGYPLDIGDEWGLPDNLDGAFVWQRNGRSYFFKGNAYYRYTRGNARVDGGYPRSITAWSNSLLGGVDAVSTAWGKSLFMSGSQYYEYNDANIKIEDGFPQDSRIGILGCNRLQLVGSNNEDTESDIINGAPTSATFKSLLTSCLLVFTVFIMS